MDDIAKIEESVAIKDVKGDDVKEVGETSPTEIERREKSARGKVLAEKAGKWTDDERDEAIKLILAHLGLDKQ